MTEEFAVNAFKISDTTKKQLKEYAEISVKNELKQLFINVKQVKEKQLFYLRDKDFSVEYKREEKKDLFYNSIQETTFVKYLPIRSKKSRELWRIINDKWSAIFGFPMKITSDNAKEII